MPSGIFKRSKNMKEKMRKIQLGKNNHNYKHGKYCEDKKYYCKDCGKEIYPNQKRCAICHKHFKIKMGKDYIINHHIYLRENSNKTIKITTMTHQKLHNKVYNYLYDKYGKKGIDDYIKWFDKKYGLK